MSTFVTIFWSLTVILFLAACGPSQDESDATATQFAGNIFATQTAQAPTPTNTFTAREAAEEHYLIGEEFRLEENWELAIEAFSRAISIDPEYAEAYLNRGLSYYMNNDESAIVDFEKAIELGVDPRTPQMFTNRGRAFSIMDEYDHAIADFDEAIALDREFVEAYVRRGSILAFYKEDFDLANADFEHAIMLDPKYHLAYQKRGAASFLQGDYESAIEDFDRAIELGDQDAYTYGARGEAYYKMGDVDQAMADFDRAIEIDPQLIGVLYFRGVAFADLGDYDRALADLAKAIELDPQDAWPYYERGYVYWITNNPSHAIADLEQAIELDPQLDRAYYIRGHAHYDLGNYEQAFEDLNRAIELDPQTADYFLSRGLILVELSKSEAAITDLETALELGLATELEQFANEVLEDLNARRSAGLVLEWLVTADELNTISDEIGIIGWDSVAEYEREYGVCRAYNGVSWSESPNVATNCFFSVTPNSTFGEFIKWLEEMEILPPSAIQILPKIEYPGEYGLFVNNLDNGYAEFSAIYLADGVAFWTTVSVGSPTADTPSGVYDEFGEAIDTFLIDILKINFENSGYSPPTSE